MSLPTQFYLTNVTVDRETARRCGLTDTYAWHQAIHQCFDTPDEKSQPFVFRVETNRGGYSAFVVSEVTPQAHIWGKWKTQDVPLSFINEGALFRFQLFGNAIKRRKGKCIGCCYSERDLERWIIRQSQLHGFELLESQWGPGRKISVPTKSPSMTIYSVPYQGLLRCKDAARLTSALVHGVGRGRSFGQGLLALVPISTR